VTRPPLVGVTGTTEPIRGLPRVRVNEAYTTAVELAGMIPVVLPPFRDARLAASVVRSLDGLLLTGGEDVDPARYGAARHESTEPPHELRDASELALVAAARRLRMPVLAICRGLQVVNVALGGSLVQDLPAERPEALPHASGGRRDARVHAVRIDPGTLLAAALGATDVRVNSSHHQAIDRLAPDLVATARATDGVIEGAEAGDGWWMVGVQWHPEELVATAEPWDRALFEALREAILSAPRTVARGAHRSPASAGA
jgi:putative glutamine amidotransferase